MDVFVDGNRVEQSFATGSLKDALLHVQSDLCPADHIVVGIRCDGRDLPGDAMAAALEQPARDFSTLEVFTGTRPKLVAEAMSQASASLQETEDACRHVVELLASGRVQEGVVKLGECLKIWQQVHDAVAKSLQMLDLDPTAVTIQDEPMLEVIAQPRGTLLQIKQALQAQDYVLLSDVLQYELGDVTDRWFSLIAHLRQEAEDRLAS